MKCIAAAAAAVPLMGLLVFLGTTTTDALSLKHHENQSRRSLLKQATIISPIFALSLAAATTTPAYAGSLLDDFGTDPTKIVQKPVEDTSLRTATNKSSNKGEAAIDPTLRASYYYPTAKKRYLPRILKVSNSIGPIALSIQQDEWTNVEEFFKDADNAVLPMKLYVSSLDGQGLGMSNSYASQMKRESGVYETQVNLLKKAMTAQNKDTALDAVEKMGVAIAQYRQVGRLTDEDGNIPSVDEMRRMAMRRPTVKVNR